MAGVNVNKKLKLLIIFSFEYSQVVQKREWIFKWCLSITRITSVRELIDFAAALGIAQIKKKSIYPSYGDLLLCLEYMVGHK